MRLLSALSVLAFSLTACSNPSANAQDAKLSQSNKIVTATGAQGQSSSLIVAELFTSQGCSSCPPAERLFSKLAERDNLITLEWHVDYWDKLVHHGSRWKDPYSKKIFTERQRSYNRSLRGQSGVYTPQAIVNGHSEGVGSRPNTVANMLENVPKLSVPVHIANDKVTVGPSGETADILFVHLLERQETDVKGGENKGKELSGRNIVLDAIVIGKTGGDAVELPLPSLKDGESCAVLVQTVDGNVGPVMGAAKCA